MPGDARFWAKVNFAISRTGCWVWVGARNGFGHGIYRGIGAHRWSYEWTHGPVGLGKVVRHGCDNAPCVNPAHLEAGTPADNRRDMLKRGRAAWQRRKPRDSSERIIFAIAALYARARGIDPETFLREVYARG